MKDEARKALMEFIGESPSIVCSRGKCDEPANDANCNVCQFARNRYRRTFTTAQDMVDLTRRMAEKGVWEKFDHYAMAYCGLDVLTKRQFYSFTAWLITDPSRFAELVYDSEVWR